MHLYDDIGDASSSLRGSTSSLGVSYDSGNAWIPSSVAEGSGSIDVSVAEGSGSVDVSVAEGSGSVDVIGCEKLRVCLY